MPPGFDGDLRVLSSSEVGERAGEDARRKKADLIVLDVMMPGIDGPTMLNAGQSPVERE